MLFSELYGAYYRTVAAVLREATRHPLDKKALRAIIDENAFGESVLNIEPAITEKRWQLLRKDGTTPLSAPPSVPMTTLEKRWLKAIFTDPRIKLFTDDVPDLADVEPLFTPDDVAVFDKYSDGDPYEDASYIRSFRQILDAIQNRYPLRIKTKNRKGGILYLVRMPEYLEYSEKDDKFRLITSGGRAETTINLSRIVFCEPYTKPYSAEEKRTRRRKKQSVTFELVDQRNALERVLLHFAHFEKQAERIDTDRYKITVCYDQDDETELVIRVLSFGPMIKVTSPQSFVERIKERLLKQKSCEH